MFEPSFFLYLVGIISAVIIIILAFMLVVKSERIRNYELSISQLRDSLDQMDEQAKLIVRTDLELNKIQEELDKKVAGLYALQRLQRTFGSTLDEREIFNKIKSEYLEDLGMQKSLGYLWQKKTERFVPYFSIGYTQEELVEITQHITSQQDRYLMTVKKEETVSLRNANTNLIPADQIKQTFKVVNFCIAPIVPKEGSRGFLFVGTTSEEFPITEGDEELITILAQSIGQALENARLFEAQWKAQQELEKRVEQRTQELTEAVKELQKANKRKGDFVSAVSHELRTPLTSIKGYAAILLGKSLGDIPDPVQERLKRINRHSDELVHMVNNLLDISRLESGKIVMKRQPCKLKEMIDNIVDLLSVQTKNKGINFTADVDEHCMVMVDKSQIERVFINLVGNAIKFTPEKGTIAIAVKPNQDMIEVSVSDNGLGIPKEAQETIFEEFQRVDNEINATVKGTGLGLSLVKNIVEAHKGKIWVESQLGSGSTFRFLLPRPEAI